MTTPALRSYDESGVLRSQPGGPYNYPSRKVLFQKLYVMFLVHSVPGACQNTDELWFKTRVKICPQAYDRGLLLSWKTDLFSSSQFSFLSEQVFYLASYLAGWKGQTSTAYSSVWYKMFNKALWEWQNVQNKQQAQDISSRRDWSMSNQKHEQPGLSSKQPGEMDFSKMWFPFLRESKCRFRQFPPGLFLLPLGKAITQHPVQGEEGQGESSNNFQQKRGLTLCRTFLCAMKRDFIANYGLLVLLHYKL